MNLLAVITIAIAATAQAFGAEPAQAEQQPDDNSAVAEVSRLTGELKKLGEWEAQYQIIEHAMDGLWSRNNWTDETDTFARETLREVAKIPPWEFDRRIDKLVERAGDRYAVQPGDRARFKSQVYREAFGFIWNNAPVLLDQTKEYVDMRLSGEAFTPEVVAEWTAESDPLLVDWLERNDRLLEALGEVVGEGKQDLFEKDVERFRVRIKTVQEIRESWAEGGWKPEDWGLENDPIQLKGVPGQEYGPGFSAEERAALLRLKVRPRRHFEYDPSTWEAYVRNFIALYDLDAGQATAAESILAELLARATDHLTANFVELAEVPRQYRQTHERYAVLRSMFEELRVRLARIPTDAQKRAVAGQQ